MLEGILIVTAKLRPAAGAIIMKAALLKAGDGSFEQER